MKFFFLLTALGAIAAILLLFLIVFGLAWVGDTFIYDEEHNLCQSKGYEGMSGGIRKGYVHCWNFANGTDMPSGRKYYWIQE